MGEENTVGIGKLTEHQLRDLRPDLVGKLVSEEQEKAAKSLTEAVKAERDRCGAIAKEALALAGQFPTGAEKLAEVALSQIADGTQSISTANDKPSLASRELKLAAAEASALLAQKSPGANPPSEDPPPSDPSKLAEGETEESWKKAFAGRKDLQTEYRDEATYLAFKRAEAKGQVRIFRGKNAA